LFYRLMPPKVEEKKPEAEKKKSGKKTEKKFSTMNIAQNPCLLWPLWLLQGP